MKFIFVCLLLSGCSFEQHNHKEITKYPDIPKYSIVEEIRKEEERWKPQK